MGGFVLYCVQTVLYKAKYLWFGTLEARLQYEWF